MLSFFYVLATDGMRIGRDRPARCRLRWFRSGASRHGSIRVCFSRHARFGALGCGYAYSGWICCSGLVRFGVVRARIMIGGVVLAVMIVDLVGVAASDFF